jgi:hypothetical protein
MLKTNTAPYERYLEGRGAGQVRKWFEEIIQSKKDCKTDRDNVFLKKYSINIDIHIYI